MSDYEATAYLSLEKLKVSDLSRLTIHIGKTYARIPVVLGQNKERT